MNIAKQTFLLALTFILLGSMTWYIFGTHVRFKLDAHALLTTTDTTITELNVQQFSPQGMLIHSLSTPMMRHVPKNNTHWMRKPHIIIMNPNQPLWEIDAEEATALYGGSQITLLHNVRIHQEKDGHHEESTFTTETISYFPQKKIAKTLAPIVLLQPQNQIQSTGMVADFDKKQVQLFKATAQGVQDVKKPPMHAYADRIHYFSEKHLIQLIGHAKITQGTDSFTAPKIQYDTLHQHIIADSDDKDKTVIVIHPEHFHE